MTENDPKTVMQRIGLVAAIIGIPTGLILFFLTAVPSYQESIQSGGSWSLGFNEQLLIMGPIVLGIIGLNVYLRTPKRDDSDI